MIGIPTRCQISPFSAELHYELGGPKRKKKKKRKKTWKPLRRTRSEPSFSLSQSHQGPRELIFGSLTSMHGTFFGQSMIGYLEGGTWWKCWLAWAARKSITICLLRPNGFRDRTGKEICVSVRVGIYPRVTWLEFIMSMTPRTSVLPGFETGVPLLMVLSCKFLALGFMRHQNLIVCGGRSKKGYEFQAVRVTWLSIMKVSFFVQERWRGFFLSGDLESAQ